MGQSLHVQHWVLVLGCWYEGAVEVNQCCSWGSQDSCSWGSQDAWGNPVILAWRRFVDLPSEEACFLTFLDWMGEVFSEGLEVFLGLAVVPLGTFFVSI